MRLLLVRLGALGDVVHAIPAAAALRAAHQDARIDWVTDPKYLPLLDLVDGIDARIGLDTRAMNGDAGLLGTVRALRRTGYDAVLDLQGLIKSATVARLTGAVRRIGFARADLREPAAAAFYTETHAVSDVPHVVRKNLVLAASLGASPSTIRFPLRLPDTPAIAAFVAAIGSAFVVLNPGAAWPNKRWPPARFGELAQAIRAQLGLASVVLWGPGDESLADGVVTSSDGAAVLAPPTDLPSIATLCRAARLVVSGDTGPLHIAGAVGTPTVSLFGPTRWERNGPWSEDDQVVSRLDRCSCVYERTCRLAAPCIEGIGVDEVLRAVEARLRKATHVS